MMLSFILFLLGQLGLTVADGGTPQYATVVWDPTIVTDTNDDGTTFQRQVLGYSLSRAVVQADGSIGAFVDVAPGELIIGFNSCDISLVDGSESNCVPAQNRYEDMDMQQGFNYVYQVTAIDFNGAATSPSSNLVTVPVNPNAVTNFAAGTQ